MQIAPEDKINVEAQYVEMKVPLYSYGCEKKVKKALSHLRGIHSVHVDYHLQKVRVWGICNKNEVLATIRKKRREARFWDQTQSNKEQIEVEDQITMAERSFPPQFTAVNSHYKLKKPWKKFLLTF